MTVMTGTMHLDESLELACISLLLETLYLSHQKRRE